MQPKQLKKIKFSLVFNRDKSLNQDGTALVQLRAYQGGKNRYFSTGIYINPEHWDQRNRRVKETHRRKLEYNQHLQDFLHHFEAYEFTAIQKYGRCPLRLLDHANVAPEETLSASFTKFCWQELERPDITPSTRRTHRCTLNLLAEFRKEVFFDEIDTVLVNRFDRFMHRRAMRVNNIHKHHRIIKAYLNRAIMFGHLPGDANPYRQFKPRHEEPERVFLLPVELAQLEAAEIPSRPASGPWTTRRRPSTRSSCRRCWRRTMPSRCSGRSSTPSTYASTRPRSPSGRGSRRRSGRGAGPRSPRRCS